MERITTIGLDIAKQVFQVHGIDGVGAVVIRRKLRRDDVVGYFKALPPCLIGIEACDRVPRRGVAGGIGRHALRHCRADQRATAGRLMSGSSLNWPTLSSVM